MSVGITKFTGGLWKITTLDEVYSVNLDNLTIIIADVISESGDIVVLEIVELFAEHGGTMNLAFRHQGSTIIMKHISSKVTAINTVDSL